MNDKKNVAIIVGGGPAPGINGVISAATIEAINRGHKVYGIRYGFEKIMAGDKSAAIELTIPQVSRIHSEGGSILLTSRANPMKSEEALKNVIRVLQELNVGYLVTIGGDDTASSARAIAQAAGGTICVGHVPKTIDNDLPLPEKNSTFGFQTAREVGMEITETLLRDAQMTSRWYLAIAMGRKAGHLALGIGLPAGATLTIIPEEFGDEKISFSLLVNIIVGSIVKRYIDGRHYGVVVLAEGLADKLDESSIPELQDVERDPHGNIRFAELDFGGMVKNGVRKRLAQLGLPKMLVVDKNVGYELRCAAPNAFDREYTRVLGFGVIDFLLQGGTDAMISRQRDNLVPIPFQNILDRDTGRIRIRLVDTRADVFRASRKYMIRLTVADLENDQFVGKLSELTGKTPAELRTEFAPAAAAAHGVAEGASQSSNEG